MKKYAVFVSYSRADYWDEDENIIPGNVVSQIVDTLESYKKHYKFEYFFDREGIKFRDAYIDRLAAAIEDSEAMLFIASKNSYASEYCSMELHYAKEQNVPIFQYCVDNAEMPRSVRFLLGGHQFYTFKHNPIDKMVQSVLVESLGREVILLKTYNVGDYYNDGVREGVVFEVSGDGHHGKIVSMNQSVDELLWTCDVNAQSVLIGTSSETDGAENMAKVMAISGWRDKYPAFAWCADLGEGWYLPSKEELITIYNSKVDIRRNLVDNLCDRYWSSTEIDGMYANCFCVWSVYMCLCVVDLSEKDDRHFVRAVAAF
ncbi:MAG: TIR domain-containing protein [Rikenellaceae bacterium]|nr:TIR domain-containing protein [Rikenellaceae bacterium]